MSLRSRDGDVDAPEDALAALYAREHAPMVRLAHLLTGSPTAAEDVVHDAFVGLAPHLDRLERPGAYLRTAVVNGCRAHHRHRARSGGPVEVLSSVELPPGLLEFAHALRRLPERQRTAVVLRYYGDLSDVEIAEHLGCARATVRVLVHRALARLREVVER